MKKIFIFIQVLAFIGFARKYSQWANCDHPYARCDAGGNG